MRWLFLILVALCQLHVARLAGGKTVDLGNNRQLEVQQTVGSGPHRSYFVVDFGNNGGGSYAFEYLFDASRNLSAQVAWSDIVSQTELDWTVTNFGSPAEPDLFVASFALLGNAETPDFNASSQSWAYWLGSWNSPSQELEWTSASTGMRDRLLSDGAFDGWRVTGYDPVSFEPLSPPVAPISIVPEPMSWLIMLVPLVPLGCYIQRVRAGQVQRTTAQ